MEITNTTDVSINPANWTTNLTLFADRNLTLRNLSYIPAKDAMALHPGLSYSVVTLACLFLLVGLFGNGMTLVVTLKSETRFKPHNILIMPLAVADTLSLITNTFNINAFGDLSLIDMQALKSTNDFTCKLFNATSPTAALSSTLMIMLICIERFIAVWCPLKARHFLMKRLTVLSVTACVGAIIVIVAIPSAVYGGNRNGTCYVDFNFNGDGKSDTIKTRPLILVMPILFIVTPMVIILSLTPLTIAKLYRQRAKRNDLTSQQASTGPDRTSVLLTTVVVMYLLLAGIPTLLIAAMSTRGTNVSALTESWGDIARICFTIVFRANYSTNFILYSWFNTEFRQKLLSMLGCPCCRAVQNQ